MQVLLVVLSLIICGVVTHLSNSDASESSYHYNSATGKNKNFTLFKHDISTGARCLDGSQGGLYTYKGR